MTRHIDLAALKSKKIGFKETGFWALDKTTRTPALFTPALNTKDGKRLKSRTEVYVVFPTKAAIYLFVVGNEVKYVGKAANLGGRINQYRRWFDNERNERSYENERIRKLKVDNGIREAVKNDGVIIYTLIIPERRTFFRGGLPFDYLDGLEQGIIQTLDPKPEWNKERRHPHPPGLRPEGDRTGPW